MELGTLSQAVVDIDLECETTSTESSATFEQSAEHARATLREQARALQELSERIDRSFGRALGVLLSTPGHVIVCGMGKSGHVGRKLAATLASTGTPSFFVHPGEAYHGDLGMITDRDTVIVISYSGETEEVVRLLPHFERTGTPVIGLVGNVDSSIGRACTVTLDVAVEREVCPNNLAPTTSTLAALAMGDALAVGLIRARSFGAQEFARLHPGGSLGRRLVTRIKDVMHATNLPMLSPTQSVRESLFTITRGRLGLALVVDEGRLVGVVTDGDLRRAMQRHDDLLDHPVSDIMSAQPVCVDENMLVSEAEELMTKRKLKALVVLDDRRRVSGILEIFDR